MIQQQIPKQTVTKKMLQIHKLHQYQKSKSKRSNPQFLLQILLSLQPLDSPIYLTLNLKGIILQLLTQICLNQYRLFSKYLADYHDELQTGKIGNKYTSTVKKRRYGGGQRGNTTTVKKKKQDQLPETTRNAANLDQMLEQSLSQPKNIQLRSQHTNSSNLSLAKEHGIQFPYIKNIQMPSWNSHEYITPLKISSDQQNQKLFDEYRKLITIPQIKKSKPSTQKKSHTKTHKKSQTSQHPPQQINTFISLQSLNQISLKKQIQNIIDLTKKKKKQQKQNLFLHSIFQLQQQYSKISSIFNNKQSIYQFYLDNYKEILQHRTDPHLPQINLLQQIFSNNYENISTEPIHLKPQQQYIEILDDQLKNSNTNQVSFTTFTKNHNMNLQQKACFFYSLLCSSQKYILNQPSIQTFSPINIKLSNCH